MSTANNRHKTRGKTDRNPVSFDFATLSTQQKKMHEGISESWNGVCIQHAALGRKLNEMHKTFCRSGAVKAGGPGSRWVRYLATVGIPKTTAQDYMKLANERDKAGIPEKAERHLASVGVPLDKPKVNDALLTPELRKKVAAIKSAKDAQALKPRIMEIARTPQSRSEDDKPLGADAADAIAKNQALVKAIGYLDRFSGEALRAKLAEFFKELRREFLDKLIPAGAKKPASSASMESQPEAEVI